MATDTRTAKLPVGSYILNYGASKTYPWMKQVAGMFNTDNGDMENYQNAILTNNEIYVPPDGVEAIGVEKLEYMNNKPKEGAHDSINNLMVMNTLKNLKPMYGGGEVKPMMGYKNGGSVMDYIHSGLDVAGMAPGLGIVPDLINTALYGGEALLAGDPVSRKEALTLMGLSGAAAIPIAGQAATAGKFARKIPGKVQKARALKGQQKRVEGAQHYIEKAGEKFPISEKRAWEIYHDTGKFPRDLRVDYPEVKGSLTRKGLPGYTADISPSGREIPLDWGKGGNFYQEGGLAGYQDGDFVGPPQAPQGFADEQNQALGESIDQRMANPEIYKGSMISPEFGANPTMMLKQEAQALEQSIEDSIESKAKKTLELIKLKGLLSRGESLDMQNPIPSNAAADSATARNLSEYLKMQMMMRGMPSVMQGMGSESMEDIR
tara:strand:+ start:169 stop:1470 length:1302 start_codon:yes stop_codon:yes gene_type:complete